MLGEPQRTPFDLQFSLFGFPIRISCWFWVVALVFAQNAAGFGRQGIFAFIVAMFLSILIHELGHAFAFRHCGIDCKIVLYHLGGLAIPTNERFGSASSVGPRNPWHDIFISAAGPVTQLLAALALFGVLRLSTGALQQEFVSLTATFFLTVSVFWAIINLVPVYPLDGGQISRNVFLLFGGSQAIRHSLMVSIIAGGAIAYFAFTREQTYLAIMFAILAHGSYQAYQSYAGGSYGRGW